MNNQHETFYRTSEVDLTIKVENFMDALINQGLLNINPDSTNVYVGRGEVGFKCVSIEQLSQEDDVIGAETRNPIENGITRFEKLFELTFQAMSEDEFIKLRIVYDIEEYQTDDEHYEVVHLFYIDSEGNESPEDNEYFDEFLSDLSEYD